MICITIDNRSNNTVGQSCDSALLLVLNEQLSLLVGRYVPTEVILAHNITKPLLMINKGMLLALVSDSSSVDP